MKMLVDGLAARLPICGRRSSTQAALEGLAEMDHGEPRCKAIHLVIWSSGRQAYIEGVSHNLSSGEVLGLKRGVQDEKETERSSKKL